MSKHLLKLERRMKKFYIKGIGLLTPHRNLEQREAGTMDSGAYL